MSVNVRHWRSKPSLAWVVCLALLGVGFSWAMLRMYLSSASQPARPAKVLEIVGQSALNNGVAANQQPVQVGTPLNFGQPLTTQAGVRVALQETNTDGARLGSQSTLTLEKDCLQLGDGTVVISGGRGCLGAIVVRGRNGIYTLRRVDYLAEIKVLAGEVEVSIPRNPAARSINLQTGQKITIGLTGDEVGPIRLMLPSEVQGIVDGELFQEFQTTLPNQTLIAQLQSPATNPSPIPLPSVSVPPPAIAPVPMPVSPPVSVTPTSPKPSPSPIAPQPVKPAPLSQHDVQSRLKSDCF